MDFGLGSYSSSSSSPSSSSSQYKTQKMASLSNSPWEPQMSTPSPNWLGNKYEPTEEDNEATATATPSTEADSTLSASTAYNMEKVHMFHKVVTPSDVGKLNRLVIPKQHAEKYFPMDSSTNEKGLLLKFEDRNGKPWRFRYSYWNSSQSYVMTKGWSRFVKDKKLESGDIVSFSRGVGDKDHLFIDWRRRLDGPDPVMHHFSLQHSTPWSPLLMRPSQLLNLNSVNRNSFSNVVNPGGTMGSVTFLRSSAPQMGMGTMEWQQQPTVFDSVPLVQGKGAAKRLRLFGVNMECSISDESHDDCEMLSTTSIGNARMASQSSQHPLQLRLYNGTPVLPPFDFLNANKGKASMSLDFNIGDHNQHRPPP